MRCAVMCGKWQKTEPGYKTVHNFQLEFRYVLADMKFAYLLFIQCSANLYFNGFRSKLALHLKCEQRRFCRIYGEYGCRWRRLTKTVVICRLIYNVNVFVSYRIKNFASVRDWNECRALVGNHFSIGAF